MSAPHKPGASLANNYPASMSECYRVGMNGGCGGECPVLKRGECETQDEMEGALSEADLEDLRLWRDARPVRS